MERSILNKLLDWKDSPYRKPLFLKGVAKWVKLGFSKNSADVIMKIKLTLMKTKCAGSLLGIALAKPSSFPVGKINFMQIDPMTFTEILLANGNENLVRFLESIDTIEPIPDAFFS